MTTELVTPEADWRGWSAATAECWAINSNCEACSLNWKELWIHKDLKLVEEKGYRQCHGANNAQRLVKKFGNPTRKNIRLNNKNRDALPITHFVLYQKPLNDRIAKSHLSGHTDEDALKHYQTKEWLKGKVNIHLYKVCEDGEYRHRIKGTDYYGTLIWKGKCDDEEKTA